MGKQTMGFPSHTLRYRNDHKMYRIQTPQSPVVRPYAHDYYGIDEYPLGTNAVVAVISYTVSMCCLLGVCREGGGKGRGEEGKGRDFDFKYSILSVFHLN